VIELLLARLIYRQGAAVLDVGHANSMACHLEMIKSLHAPRNISGIDIAQPVFDVSKYYSDSICGDVADSGFPDGTFDVIWCISALEHFGMDNSQYAAGFSGADSCASAALREMIRIAQPHGQVLVTVPFGKYENHGWFLNFDREHWQNLLCSVSHDTDVRQLYFRHTSGDGWAAVDPFELTHTGYYDQSNSGAGGLAVALITKL
jgi:SAM-dependent methyltransferase